MVLMIGLVTIAGLVWVIGSAMARESTAEKRRGSMAFGRGLSPALTDFRENMRQAA